MLRRLLSLRQPAATPAADVVAVHATRGITSASGSVQRSGLDDHRSWHADFTPANDSVSNVPVWPHPLAVATESSLSPTEVGEQSRAFVAAQLRFAVRTPGTRSPAATERSSTAVFDGACHATEQPRACDAVTASPYVVAGDTDAMTALVDTRAFDAACGARSAAPAPRGTSRRSLDEHPAAASDLAMVAGVDVVSGANNGSGPRGDAAAADGAAANGAALHVESAAVLGAPGSAGDQPKSAYLPPSRSGRWQRPGGPGEEKYGPGNASAGLRSGGLRASSALDRLAQDGDAATDGAESDAADSGDADSGSAGRQPVSCEVSGTCDAMDQRGRSTRVAHERDIVDDARSASPASQAVDSQSETALFSAAGTTWQLSPRGTASSATLPTSAPAWRVQVRRRVVPAKCSSHI